MAVTGVPIGDVVAAANSALGLKSPGASWDTKYRYITNNPTYDDAAWRKSLGYGFRVVEVNPSTNEISEIGTWDPFVFQINPQEFNQSEIFAIKVTPTFRGVVVEHQGSVLKDITLSGTTGNSPKRREGGAFPDSGKPILADGRSGYEEFHELRSYFRAYVEAKRLYSEKNKELRLIFDNFKDAEFLFVEPQKFTLKRDRTAPFQYRYEIQLKGIGVATGVKKDLDAFEDLVDKLDRVSAYLAVADNLIRGGIGLINRIERGAEALIFGNVNKITSALNSLKAGKELVGGGLSERFQAQEQQTAARLRAAAEGLTTNGQAERSVAPGETPTLSASGVTASFLDDFAIEIQRIVDNLADSLGISLSSYNQVIERVSTLATTQASITPKEHGTVHGCVLLIRGMQLLLSDSSLFSDSAATLSNRIGTLYDNKISIERSGSTRITKIQGGDTIQKLASRELGSADRYRELVIMNNLVPPYISDTPSVGVLSYGDEILIPQRPTGESIGIKTVKEYNVTAGMTEAEKALGVDLRLDGNNDIAINNIGDFDIHAGMENFAQAMLLRMYVEKGSLQRNRQYGLGLGNIGGKLTTKQVRGLTVNIEQSLNSDPRTESVVDIQTKISGGTIEAIALVNPKKSEHVVPIPISLNVS